MFRETFLRVECQVWVPILTVDKIAVAWTLQQIPDLLRAEVEDSIKLEEAEKVVDALSQQMLVRNEQAATRSKMCLVCRHARKHIAHMRVKCIEHTFL